MKKRLKVGDMVRCAPDVYGDENAVGIIIGWLKTGGVESTLWEVFYKNGDIDSALENELELINESG